MRLAIKTALVLAGVAVHALASAQGLVPYERFKALSDRDAKSVQIRIGCLASRTSFMGLVGFCHADSVMRWERFAPFENPRIRGFLPTDSVGFDGVRLSGKKLRDFVFGLGAIPELADGGIDEIGWVVSVTAFDGDTLIGFESIVGNVTVQSAFAGAYSVTPDSSFWQLAIVSNAYGVTPPIGARDATRDVEVTIGTERFDAGSKVTIGKAQFDARSNEYRCRVSVKNVSSTALAGPIIVVIGIPSDVKLLNGDGRTEVIVPMWAPYKILAATELASGRSVSAELRLTSDDEDEVPVGVYRVLSGPGVR